MPEDWTITFEGFEYGPIPQSWLDHPYAEDRGRQELPRLFAVSTAPYGRRTLKIRYGEPRTGNVLILQLPADELDSGGIVPESLLTGAGWSRSLCPPARVEPRDVLRPPEQRYLRALWADTGLAPDISRVVAGGGDDRGK